MIGAGASIAGAGLGAYGDILKGQGTQAADVFKASMLEQAAERGRVAAVQTGAEYSRKIATDLGNIDAVRAAGHTDPTSPSGMAVRDYHENIGLSQKAIAVDNIMAQAQQQEAEAAYLRKAGAFALTTSYVSAAADIAKGAAQAFSPGSIGAS